MKYALFTGAAGGLGGASALALIEKGWTVFAADYDEVALKKKADIVGFVPIKVDITNMESIEAAKQEVLKTTDHLDAVINFAGIHSMGSLIEGDIVKTVERMVDINVLGMIRINRVFFDMVKKGNGRIINCSSECGWMKAQPFNGPYSITKYAVEAYSDSLRRELLFQDIKCVKIQPGSFKTQMHGQASAAFDKMINNTEYYKKTLSKMKPMMLVELKMANDPKYLVRAVVEACEADKPKNLYRVKNSKLLGTLEFVPDKVIDSIYKVLLKNK
ncbi:MAG: SDR family NAD(P)-dependent oxidoreductase [Clostridia bacterium]|nr:SDR family NAD(P)-dependent oxidoreductase [Clostridia bacterium]